MMRIFVKRMAVLICMCILLMGNAHLSIADDLTAVEAFFTAPEGYSGYIFVPGIGERRYYAQNDPLWGALCYEKSSVPSRRPFRDSGCSPTALAMIIAQMIDEAELPLIDSAVKNDFSLCTCSLNKIRCIHNHDRYYLTSLRDYRRFLPLIFGDYAAGNNLNGTYSRNQSPGTSSEYMKEVAQIYGLDMSMTTNKEEAFSALNNENMGVIALAAAGGCFTNNGHYVVLTHYDDEKLYVLDPLYRTQYKTHNSKKLEIIQPGCVALTHENIRYAQFVRYYIFSKNDYEAP